MTAYEISMIMAGLKETFYMIGISALFIVVCGLLIGFTLYLTDRRMTERKGLLILNQILSGIVNIFRSIPFVILIVMMIPVTLILTNGQMLGANGALPPLIVSATPFFGRMVYNALLDIPFGKVEALRSLGASTARIMWILCLESLPVMIANFTVTLITLIGFISAANAIGGGGLSDQAVIFLIHSGQDKRFAGYMAVLIILAIVLLIQLISDSIIKRIKHS